MGNLQFVNWLLHFYRKHWCHSSEIW